MEMSKPIEFIKDFANGVTIYQKGHIMAEPMSAGWADVLVQRGIARYYEPVPPVRKALRLQQPMGKRRKKKRV